MVENKNGFNQNNVHPFYEYANTRPLRGHCEAQAFACPSVALFMPRTVDIVFDRISFWRQYQKNGWLAQLVEHRPYKPRAGSSSLSPPTNKNKGLLETASPFYLFASLNGYFWRVSTKERGKGQEWSFPLCFHSSYPQSTLTRKR